MGYTTEFEGHFQVDRPVDDDTLKLLTGLNRTRRMSRRVDPSYGVEGEFYVDGTGFAGQDRDASVIDYNRPPSTQPSLWCQWQIDEQDKQTIAWDGGEKFYNYVEWIKYIIDKVLIPRGYSLSGEVHWQGENRRDIGRILIVNNQVEVASGSISFG
jgi:hypothetical protein